MSIVVRTLSERVFEIVREQIVSGALSANAPIRQDALAAELGVSKIPLREALGRLEQEGLLTSQANRGYFVQPMCFQQVDEIYALRLALEPQAAAYAATQADTAGKAPRSPRSRRSMPPRMPICRSSGCAIANSTSRWSAPAVGSSPPS